MYRMKARPHGPGVVAEGISATLDAHDHGSGAADS